MSPGGDLKFDEGTEPTEETPSSSVANEDNGDWSYKNEEGLDVIQEENRIIWQDFGVWEKKGEDDFARVVYCV